MFSTSQWLEVHHIIEHFTLTIRFSLLRVWPTATWDQVMSLPTGGCRIPTLSTRRRGWAWGRALTTADFSLSAVSQFAAALPDSESAVNVEGVRLKAVLCCTARRDCEPCLQVIITIRGGGLAQTTTYVKGVCLPHGVLATIHLCFIAAFLLWLQLHLSISIHCCLLQELTDHWLEVYFLSGTNSPNPFPLETNEHNDEEELRSAEGSGQAEPPELTGTDSGTRLVHTKSHTTLSTLRLTVGIKLFIYYLRFLAALVKVCFSSPGGMEFCMALNFKARHAGTNRVTQQPTHEVKLRLYLILR